MESILSKYPDRVPVRIDRAEKADIPDIDKHKYLVPRDMTLGQFVYVIRKRINLNEAQAIFVFVGNTILPPTSAMMGQLYDEHKDDDKLLYIKYSGENTFG